LKLVIIEKLKTAKESEDGLLKHSDIAYNVIIKIESGRTPNPTAETMSKIARGLSVSVDNLIK